MHVTYVYKSHFYQIYMYRYRQCPYILLPLFMYLFMYTSEAVTACNKM